MGDRTLSNWLRAELRRREWKQADLARALGVSTGRVSGWVTGKQVPKPASIDRIADVLGADGDMLLTLAGHRPTPDPITADDPVERLIAKLRRLRHLEDWQVQTVEVMLDVWLRKQREERVRAAASPADGRAGVR